ncbi:PRC-barrel domain-containing protein, partial [Candidatus Pacearchaeota archaeon]|nr:PRC-barrel domain-containing protein [Candidatus Pacearchaeota archaeon]
GLRDWKAETLSSSQCYKATASDTYDVTIIGDITATISSPKRHYETNGRNYTQEDIIGFLADTYDDCGTSLGLNTSLEAGEIQFYMSGTNTYNCTEGMTLVGANAYTCDLITSFSTTYGWYNLSLFTKKDNYYDKTTYKTADPGVFYMNPVSDIPIQTSPENNSNIYAEPVALAWTMAAILPGTNMSYYVYGDAVDGSTFLSHVTDTVYLWRGLSSGTYYWKVMANDGTYNSSFSPMKQFNLNLCAPDTTYGYAENYPMSYNSTTDTITVIGNSSFGSSMNPITLENIYQYGRAVRGTCAMAKPASGIYIILSQIVIGNTTQDVYVQSKSESVSFTSENMPELTVNKNAHMIFGGISNDIPQEGVSLKFTSNQSNDILLDIAGGELALYDSYVTDVGINWGNFIYRGNCGSGTGYSDDNSSITIKKTIFDRATRGQFFYTSNVMLDDVKFNRVNSSAVAGYGIVSGCNLPALNNLQIYHKEQENGSAIMTSIETPAGTELVVQNSILGYNTYDVVASGSGRGISLVNTRWDRKYGWNFNATNSLLNGTTAVKESYGFLPTVTDSSGAALANTTIVAMNIFGDIYFAATTDSSGTLSEKYIPTWQAEKSTVEETVTDYNPYRVLTKNYGKSFTTEAKTFAARTVETKQLVTNIYSSLSEAQVLALDKLEYTPPTKVSYGDEVHSGWTTIGQLDNYPIDQCQYFALFANGTKLVEGSTNNYTINYATGAISFKQNMGGYEIDPVYYYGGSLSATNGLTVSNAYTMQKLYDFMQYQTARNNLSEELTTSNGILYSFCIDLNMGNDTSAGSIKDPGKTIEFEGGYDARMGAQGGLLELAGVTTGTSGLVLYSSVGSNYNPGNTVIISAITTDNGGNLISAPVNTTVTYPNGTALLNGLATETTTGRYNLTFVLPSTSPEGTYGAKLDTSLGTNTEAHNILSFTVTNISSGRVYPPTIELLASTPISVLTTASVGVLVKSETGISINCSGSMGITIRNLANGNSVYEEMTNFGTGMYNYSWTTPDTPSVFYVSASCPISGINYTGFTLISTQSIGATATVNYNQIAEYVWNYASRNLTYYNQSVAESLENCLKDGACSGWWLNTTLANIHALVSEINATSLNIYNNTQELINYLNCSSQNEVCLRLNNILGNATEIQNMVWVLNNTHIPDLRASISNISNDVQWITNGTGTNNTQVMNELNNMQSNITFIMNNMFYQGNATNAFLVDYLSSVYAEQGSVAELWILTKDLLGNAKTLSAAECQIEKAGAFVENATTIISNGGVYSYWDISQVQSTGVHYFNCTLTGSTLNLKVPFFVGGATTNFEISSLVSASPKYPNENAIIEATFATKNGSVAPDTINMTILKPNYLTVWYTANKNDFSNNNGVWSWIQMIEASPTTGTYYAQMTATYNGTSDSKTTQFRIATGGPYKVYLDCPTSSNVGTNLVCNIMIQDEGEATTESTSIIWVDSDNDGVLDTGEPQTSFSKETQPFQNISETITINVPSAHTTGTFVVRADTEYLNSGQPHSTASDSVTLSAASGNEGSSGGGGGGGGGGSSSSPTITGNIINRPFNIMDILIKVYEESLIVKPGGKVTAELTFYNLGTDEIKDVKFNYWVEDGDGNKITKEVGETVAVYTKIQQVKRIILPKEMEDGVYYIYTKANYGNQTAEARASFEVSGKQSIESFTKFNFVLLFMIIIVILIILVVYIISRKMGRIDMKEGGKMPVSRTVELGITGLCSAGLIWLFAATSKANVNISGFAINSTAGEKSGNMTWIIILAAIFVLLSVHQILSYYRKYSSYSARNRTQKPVFRIKITQKIKELFGRFSHMKLRNSDRLNDTIGMKVYSSAGIKIGKIKEVMLKGNKIYGWIISLDKKIIKNVKAKNILVKHEHVTSLKDILIINEKIIENLEKIGHDK